MHRIWTAALGLVLAAGLAGCADGPVVQAENPRGISLYWYNWQADGIDAAKAEADRHCQASGGHAVLTGEFTDQDVTRAAFICRPY
jgi:hypothetical protein